MTTLLLALLCQDDPLKGWKHPWSGFAPGSRVTFRQTSKRPDISPAGELVYKDEIQEMSHTVVTQDGERPTIRIRSGDVSSDIPYSTPQPNWFRGKREDGGRETLKVGERALDCRVTRYTLDEGKDLSQVTTLHTAEGAPVWVRLRVETKANGAVTTSEEERWVGEDAALKIGGREVYCQLMEVRTEVKDGPLTIKREWRSDEIPGRLARREQKVLDKGKEVPGAATQMEVVSFEAKR